MSATVRKDLRELVANTLAGLSLGSLSGGSWPIYYRKMPDTPDECIVVACYGLGGDFEHGVQVRVRGSNEVYTSAEDKADAIRMALHGLENVSRGSTALALLTHTSTADLGSDTLSRDEVAVNFRALTDDPNTALDY